MLSNSAHRAHGMSDRQKSRCPLGHVEDVMRLCRNRTYNLVIKRVPNPVKSGCKWLHPGNGKSFFTNLLNPSLGKTLPSVTRHYRLLQEVCLLAYPPN